LAAEAVRHNCYTDDLMPSLPTVEIAEATRRQLAELGSLAGFHIRKWISNPVEVLEDIPEADRASGIDLERNKFPTTKTLGVLWTAERDTFSFSCKLTPGMKLTKRNVLKKTATIYDVLGFLTPYVVRAKRLIQKAWMEAADWDVLLPVRHQEQWRAWFQESRELEQIKIPRCLKDRGSKTVKVSLYTFSDASESAYAASVYVHHEYEDGSITARLAGSKTLLPPP